MIKSYERKKSKLEAVQWLGSTDNLKKIEKLIIGMGPKVLPHPIYEDSLLFVSLRGCMRVDVRDWIVKDANSEVYFISSHVFETFYREVPEEYLEITKKEYEQLKSDSEKLEWLKYSGEIELY